MEEIVDFLKDPKRYTEAGATLPKGILLVGPPGVGKTLLAKALSGESGSHFEHVNSSSIEGMYVGMGASKIRKLFEAARHREQTTILFFDEFDSIASKRFDDFNGSTRQSLNQILTEIDGFDQNSKVFILAATNFPESLDPAILRPGRFDKVVRIPTPSFNSRKEIVQYYLGKVNDKAEVDVDYLSGATIGMTGADIRNLVNIAAINAVKNSKRKIDKNDFDFAIDRINIGILNKSVQTLTKDLFSTAVHESGHALVSLFNSDSVPMSKVTILSKGGSLGLTHQTHCVCSPKGRVLEEQGQVFGPPRRGHGRKGG